MPCLLICQPRLSAGFQHLLGSLRSSLRLIPGALKICVFMSLRILKKLWRWLLRAVLLYLKPFLLSGVSSGALTMASSKVYEILKLRNDFRYRVHNSKCIIGSESFRQYGITDFTFWRSKDNLKRWLGCWAPNLTWTVSPVFSNLF